MSKLLLITFFILIGCTSKQTNYTNAENAFDAGREFVDGGLKGDFLKAAFYMLPDENNKQYLAELEKEYRKKDKEGRQQFRTASINIQEVTDIDSITSIIAYSNSYDKQLKHIKVVKENNIWLVDYKFSFTKP
jgi:hypothetical protein